MAEETEKTAEEERKAAKAQEGAAEVEAGFFRKLLKKSKEDGEEKAPEKGTSSASLILVVLGLVHYALGVFLGGSDVLLGFSLVLFVLSGYALSNKVETKRMTIFLPMIAFAIWYFVFQATIESAIYLIVGMILLFGLPAVITKGKTVKAEFYGLLPIVVFFMDLGYASFLLDELKIPITDFTVNLIQFMPWWFFLGLLTLPNEPSKSGKLNLFIQILRIVGVLWVIFAFVVPAIPELGFTKESILPSIEKLQETKQRVKEELPQRENPLFSNIKCIGSGRYEDLAACVDERRLRSELESICEQRAEEEDLIATDEYLERCIAEEEARRERERIQVSGTRDPTIKEPLEIQFEKGEFFPEKTYRRESEVSRIRYPIDLIIKNPRQQEITVAVSCGFTKMGSSSEENAVAGKIVGPAEFIIGEASKTQTLVCEPETPLDGRYTLNYTAQFLHLKTFSRLSRAFIGELRGESFAEREALKDEILQAHFSGSTAQSQAPNDPVQLHFAMGNPIDNPIIEEESGLLLAATIKNEGRGEILRINQYSIFLPGFTVDDPRCLDDVDVELPSEQGRRTEDLHLPLCSILSLPFELKNPGEQDYFFREFTAELDYDYVLTEDVSVEVEAIS